MKRKKPFECQSNHGNTPPHKMRLKNSKLGDINFQIRVCVTAYDEAIVYIIDLLEWKLLKIDTHQILNFINADEK